MEGVAALSLAANVLQVVDFAQKLLSAGNEIYHTGSTVSNTEVEVVLKDLGLLNRRIKSRTRPNSSTIGPLNEDSQSLRDLALQSEKIVQQLVTVLTTLKVANGTSRYQSFKQAVRTAWTDKEVKEIKARLNEIRTQLMFRIQVLSNDDILESLDDASRRILLTVVTAKDNIVDKLQYSEETATRRHLELLHCISVARNVKISAHAITEQIKGLLRYPTQNDRHEDIAQAHTTTFKWILDHRASKHADWPDLYTWLRNEHGIYWISGKAGSGKSTLMKSLHQDPRLLEALTAWAEHHRLLIISFYFWNAGSDLQRSQEGFFRSVLYQVLQQEPSYAQALFPEQFLVGASWNEFPTFQDVRRAFRRLVACSNIPIKIALFVDGLDEFEAIDLTMAELAEIFNAATAFPNVKMVLSSRPLAPFEFAFKSWPKLRLHQLTHGDITTYVFDKLDRDPRIATMGLYNTEDLHHLIGEIVESASGVFLWVTLVVGSLLEGLQNFDRIPDLRRRLRDLPRDLDALFKHMLRRIPESYKAESSRMFQIVRCYKEECSDPLPVMLLQFVDVEESYVLDASITPVARHDRLQHEEEISGRLRSRCLGLLEVRPHNTITKASSFSCVEYLHRTVLDFLKQPEVWSDIVRATSRTRFDPNTSLVRSFAMQAKVSCVQTKYQFKKLIAVVRNAMSFADGAERSTDVACTVVLDEIDRTMTTHWQSLLSLGINERFDNWCEFYLGDHPGVGPVDCYGANFLTLAVASGLRLYVREKINAQGSRVTVKSGRSLLDYACYPRLTSLATVKLLLDHGANPNESCCSIHETVWQRALLGGTNNRPLHWISALALLAQHGANLNMTIIEDVPEDQETQLQRKWSGLRFIKLKIGLVLYDNQEDNKNVERLDPWRGYRPREHLLPHPDQMADFRSKSDRLVQLLVSRGAKEEEWCKNGDQDWEQTFPPGTASHQVDESKKVSAVLESEGLPPVLRKRSPLMQIGARIHRSLHRKDRSPAPECPR